MRFSILNTLKKKIPVGRRRAILGAFKEPLRKWTLSTATEKLGLNIVTREELLKNSEKYHVLPFGSKESIVVTAPYNGFHELPKGIASTISTITPKQPLVSEVTNAELIGPAAVGFDEDGNLLSETVPTLSGLEKYLPARTLILKNLPNFGVPQLDTVCSLVNWWSKNYFHWTVDCLTRIEGLEYYQHQTGTKPALIIDSNPSHWQIESLKLLGYDPSECLQWNALKIKAKRLVVPSFRRKGRLISPAACRWIRQRMLSNLPSIENQKLSFSSRIYISRPKTAGRQVANEDHVLEVLIPLGFAAYTLEEMSYLDQVRLFSQAEIVVAPHGAGLTNIIFAQNLIVIELFGSFGSPSYFLIAKALGFLYGCLTSEFSGSNQYNEKFSGMTVDVGKLRALVTEMLSVGSAHREPLLYSAKS